MTKQTDTTPQANKPQVIESGWGAFALVWVKTIALTTAIVLILKYVFKFPLAF